MSLDAAQRGPVVHGTAQRAVNGAPHCGDQAVTRTEDDRATLAVIDGLGHGPHAQVAADAAAEVISRHADEGPVPLLQRCHAALRGTRGAAVSLAIVSGDTLDWLAVGNVQGVVQRGSTLQRTRLVTRAGIVGSRLPRLVATSVRLGPGDLLLMFTDGVSDAVVSDRAEEREPATLAARLLERHATGADDALVLAARRTGRTP